MELPQVPTPTPAPHLPTPELNLEMGSTKMEHISNLDAVVYGFAAGGFLTLCVTAGLYAGLAIGWLLRKVGWLR